MATPQTSPRYVLCISDRGDVLSVLKGKVYRVVTPDPNDPPHDIRIVDETGEDYPYPREWFGEVELSQRLIDALQAA